MQKIFASIGIITLVVGVWYFLVYCPIVAFRDLERENTYLKQALHDSEKEVEDVYKCFDQALKCHLPSEKVNEIYSDKTFFNKTASEISINLDGSRKFQQLNSFR